VSRLPPLYICTTTFAEREEAERVARLLVSDGLVACAQIGSDLTSYYRWRGELCRDTEIAVTLKICGQKLEACLAKLRELHPYDTPQIVVWSADVVDPDYLRWACEESR